MVKKRTVQIADEPYRILQESFDWVHALDDQLTALICKLTEKRARMQRDAWETAYRLCDKKFGEHVMIDWVNKCLVVTDGEIER